ncbi:P-loop containing nucleoside triphosphate hydrolase protein [Piromyces finnis]|uniref:p-loop containing nucleoside triphosphate hydrolase protein n=1 Tax=Piromyces finnis TaxID=1754191 RepID=A0A1Y1VHK4_9FUNG|nr:P-loop containing nucleoside triphosphate hydrolase protein [Piromyces finnis]|eukprot:ORX56503.1 P-loop containing nucleoside triphosphate hydrolase protein [Piromyces finnis]
MVENAENEASTDNLYDNDESVSPTSNNNKKTEKISLSPHGYLSDLFFLWVFRFIRLCKSFDVNNIQLLLGKTETAKYMGKKLYKSWRYEIGSHSRQPSVLRSLFRVLGKNFALLAIWKVFWIFFTWCGAYWLLKQSILYIENYHDPQKKNEPEYAGHLYALGLLISSVISSICFHQLYIHGTKIGIQARAGLMVLIYRKSLKLSSLSNGIGNIVNLISNDCNRVAEICINFHFLWSSVIEALIIVIIALIEIGYSALPALFIIIFVLLPLQIFLPKYASTTSLKTTFAVTKRVQLMSEILTVMRLIKMYAWEKFFVKKVNEARENEMNLIKKALRYKTISFMIVFTAPMLTTFLCLITYQTLEKKQMKPAVTFTILSLFNTLRYPMTMLPTAIRSIIGAQVAFKRLDEFFILPEAEDYINYDSGKNKENVIEVVDGCFEWQGSENPAINNINLNIKHGQHAVIIGDFASCSTLIAAITGQIRLVSGNIDINGSIGYIPQEPWIINGTIQDNIIFGQSFNEERYNKIIDLCLLSRDISIFPQGDKTELTDRGANLSPSQRQKISIARCLYNEADLILIEDSFCVFEPQVAKLLFKNCVKEFLKDKAILFVTQQSQFLPECDTIIIIEDGEIVEQGSFEELKERQVSFSQLVNDEQIALDDELLDFNSNEEVTDSRARSVQEYLGLPSANNGDMTIHQLNNLQVEVTEATISKIIEKNQRSVLSGARVLSNNQETVHRTIEQNQLTMHSILDIDANINRQNETDITYKSMYKKAYISYIKSAIGIPLTILLLIFFIVVHSLRFISDYWLKYFIDKDMDNIYLLIYAGLTLGLVVGAMIRGFLFCSVIAKKSQSFHNGIFNSIMRAPMYFFDTTPLGLILAAFAKHLYLIDDYLPDTIFQFLHYFPFIVGTVIMVLIVVPYLWTVIIVFIFAVVVIRTYSRLSEHRLEQLESNSKAPLFLHLSTTLEGLFSIRVYRTQDRFTHLYKTLVDENHKALFSLMFVKTWVSFYIDIVASIFIYVAALFLILFKDSNFSLTEVTPSSTGLALSNVLQLLVFLQWLIRAISDIHGAMYSCSTLRMYTDHVPCEAPAIVNSNRPPEDWPSNGKIDFRNVVVRYYQYSIAVLKNITFSIRAHETVGVVGKSESGKTTLMMSLLRMVEASEGSIYIDGLNIRDMGLHDIRSRIAIIPQEPVLFAGTIRSNLDPFERLSDNEIWQALSDVHIAESIEEMPLKLETQIIENGRNFTLSQRLLFMIARAILLNTKIVVLDEPLAALDYETGELIQNTIWKCFENKTLIIIASQLSHIMKADRIMVLEGGRVTEFDTPYGLLSNPNGSFTRIIEQSGDLEAQKIKKDILSKFMPPKSNESGLHVMFKEDPNHVSKHANKLSQSSKPQSTPMPKSLENVFYNIRNNSETIKNTSSSSQNTGGYTNLLSLYINPNETKETKEENKPKTQEEIERDITNRRSDDFLRDNNIFIE